jgi:hypothetical protein
MCLTVLGSGNTNSGAVSKSSKRESDFSFIVALDETIFSNSWESYVTKMITGESKSAA